MWHVGSSNSDRYPIARSTTAFYTHSMKIWLEDIEQELYRMLPLRVGQNWLEMVLQDSSQFSDDTVFDAICEPARDLVYRGGKRWRPLLMLLVAKMLGGQTAFDTAKQLITLVELPHNGSLIIDDIEDGSDLRRGKPATHITYGTDISINAGNMLYFLPTLAIDEASVSEHLKLRLYQIYATYMRKIHLGQGMDITWHHTSNLIPSVEAYEMMCRMKTGCLAAMGAELGAAIATEDLKVIKESGRIAETLGYGFQIIDDVINLEKGNPGKNRGDDIVENKKSLPIILYANAHPEKREELFRVLARANKIGYDAAKDEIMALITSIEDAGVLSQAREFAFALFEQVIKDIEKVYESSSDRDFLIAMVHSFLNA